MLAKRWSCAVALGLQARSRVHDAWTTILDTVGRKRRAHASPGVINVGPCIGAAASHLGDPHPCLRLDPELNTEDDLQASRRSALAIHARARRTPGQVLS
ncbi:hypothetical protein FKP32DRAFT_1593744 [Trametes sanguinea]|nr:hypothetical protein FKP32DRAFT_1593744 [Trametes sanguinea]